MKRCRATSVQAVSSRRPSPRPSSTSTASSSASSRTSTTRTIRRSSTSAPRVTSTPSSRTSSPSAGSTSSSTPRTSRANLAPSSASGRSGRSGRRWASLSPRERPFVFHVNFSAADWRSAPDGARGTIDRAWRRPVRHIPHIHTSTSHVTYIRGCVRERGGGLPDEFDVLAARRVSSMYIGLEEQTLRTKNDFV